MSYSLYASEFFAPDAIEMAAGALALVAISAVLSESMYVYRERFSCLNTYVFAVENRSRQPHVL